MQPGLKSVFKFMPKVLDGVRVKALVLPHQTRKTVSLLGFVDEDIVMLKQEIDKHKELSLYFWPHNKTESFRHFTFIIFGQDLM